MMHLIVCGSMDNVDKKLRFHSGKLEQITYSINQKNDTLYGQRLAEPEYNLMYW